MASAEKDQARARHFLATEGAMQGEDYPRNHRGFLFQKSTTNSTGLKDFLPLEVARNYKKNAFPIRERHN